MHLTYICYILNVLFTTVAVAVQFNLLCPMLALNIQCALGSVAVAVAVSVHIVLFEFAAFFICTIKFQGKPGSRPQKP